MNSNQKGPLSPLDIFNRLLYGNFKEAECKEEVSRLSQQRQILIQLILQYEEEIKKAQLLAIEEDKLIQLREKLLVELEILRKERLILDSKITEEVNTLRCTPIQLKEQAAWMQELNDSRTRNNKLKIKIKDLMVYIEKLETQNARLQEEKKILQVNSMNQKHSKEDWRLRIETLKREHLSYQYELRQKMKIREVDALRNIQIQEVQIRERNQRRRMQSLHGKMNTPIKQLSYSGYPRQI